MIIHILLETIYKLWIIHIRNDPMDLHEGGSFGFTQFFLSALQPGWTQANWRWELKDPVLGRFWHFWYIFSWSCHDFISIHKDLYHFISTTSRYLRITKSYIQLQLKAIGGYKRFTNQPITDELDGHLVQWLNKLRCGEHRENLSTVYLSHLNDL